MKFFKTYQNYLDQFIQNRLIEILHEGVKVTSVKLNETSNTANFAQREMDIVIKDAEKRGTTALIAEFVPEMLALIDKFGNSGQSGGSAPFYANAITSALKKLLMQEPIAPIMNSEDEWNNCQFGDEETWQNKRCYSLFKKGKDGDPYYINAIVFKTPNGNTWTGSAQTEDGQKITSRQNVREFLFEPKTFVIDVDEKEVKKDDWEFYIKDVKQLDDVFKYYKPM